MRHTPFIALAVVIILAATPAANLLADVPGSSCIYTYDFEANADRCQDYVAQIGPPLYFYSEVENLDICASSPDEYIEPLQVKLRQATPAHVPIVAHPEPIYKEWVDTVDEPCFLQRPLLSSIDVGYVCLVSPMDGCPTCCYTGEEEDVCYRLTPWPGVPWQLLTEDFTVEVYELDICPELELEPEEFPEEPPPPFPWTPRV